MRDTMVGSLLKGTVVGSLLKGTMVGRWLGITEPEVTPRDARAPASGSRKGRGTVNLYMILLRGEVWRRRKFRERNPNRQDNMPCVYVGQTSHTPEKRFSQHRRGYKASATVRKYGVRLLPDLYKDLNPVPATEREKREERLARDLQMRGYGVWWN